jgi:hypothetical protein
MTPKEKKRLDGRAKRAGLSTAEFVRRRVNSDDLDDHREEIEALLSTLEAAAPAILQSVESTIATAIARPDGAVLRLAPPSDS